MKPIKVIIKDLSGKQTHGANFDTHEEAQAWVEKQQSKPRPWGYQKEGVFKDKPDGVTDGFEFIDVVVVGLVDKYFVTKEAEYFENERISEEEGEVRSVEVIEIHCKVNKQYSGDLPDEFINQSSLVAQEKTNKESIDFLNSTDWKVIRHIEQKGMNITTSLDSAEFEQLTNDRQMARDAVVRHEIV